MGARARQHRRAVRDRPPDRRRHHQHRPGPRRAPRRAATASPGSRASCSRRSPPTALAVLDAGDPQTPGLAAPHAGAACVLVVGAASADADVRGLDVELDAELRPRSGSRRPGGAATVALAVRGAHQVVNATPRRRGRAGTRRRRSTSVAAGLAAVATRAVAHGAGAHRRRRGRAQRRLQRQPVVDGRRARGAAPASPVPGRRIAVLGRDARARRPERGRARRARRARRRDPRSTCWSPSARTRRRMAAAARGAGVAVTEVADAAAALDAATGSSHGGDAVLVKASRAVGLERVATALRGSGPEQPEPGADDRAPRRHRRRVRRSASSSTPALIRVLRAQGHRPADPRRRPVRPPAREEGGHADDGRHRHRRARARRLPRRPRAAPSRPSSRAPASRSWRSSSAWRSSASSTTTSACGAAGTSGCASGARPAGSCIVAVGLRAARARLGERVDAPVVHPRARPRPRHRPVVRGRGAHRLRLLERGEPHRRAGRSRRRVGRAGVRRVRDHRLLAVPPPGRLPRARPPARSTSPWWPPR